MKARVSAANGGAPRITGKIKNEKAAVNQVAAGALIYAAVVCVTAISSSTPLNNRRLLINVVRISSVVSDIQGGEG